MFRLAASESVTVSGMPKLFRNPVGRCALVLAALVCIGSGPIDEKIPPRKHFSDVEISTMTFTFDREALDGLGMALFADGNLEGIADGLEATFAIYGSSNLRIRTYRNAFAGLENGRAGTRGAFLVKAGAYRDAIGTLTFSVDEAGSATIVAAPDSPTDELTVFDVHSIVADLERSSETVLITGELVIAAPWAKALGVPAAAGLPIGTLWLDGALTRVREGIIGPADSPTSERATSSVVPPRATWAVERHPDFRRPPQRAAATMRATELRSEPQPSTSRSIGSDVVIADLQSVGRYGRQGDITAYAVGTNACNLGDEEANWIKNTNQHPVIVQNMYRLKEDKLEQIGLSWVKHGFYAVSFDLCGRCNDPTPEGSHLAVGCSDPYSASLNGVQGNMSPTSTVNAHTGYFPYPWGGWNEGPASSSIERRLQVHDADLDPALNDGAVYFVQGHYVMADDAANGTHDNNASYREVDVTNPSEGVYKVSVSDTAFTQVGQPAVKAWRDYDPTVEEVDVRVPGEGLLILAAKATDLGTGLWRYAYALQNLNSDRSAGAFTVPLPGGAVVSNVGFHDVDYHSGDPYDLTDWTGHVSEGAIAWAAQPYEESVNANAIRFGTLYSFYFDANVDPAATTVTIGLFKPGFPDSVTASIIGPKLDFIDCNGNGIMDVCDVDCHPTDSAGRPLIEYCAVPEGMMCGTSVDCNGNWVPDECEPDCNDNEVADSCDIASAASSDCNDNSVPDDCEPDCDGNGIADDCEELPDYDGDGFVDCFDRCRLNTPPKTCSCPEFGACCFPPELGSVCTPEPIAPEVCLSFGAIPDCLEQPCRQGCLIGDFDEDGDLDLADAAAYQLCISLDVNDPAYEPPIQECSIPLDFDDDDDVDVDDVRMFLSLLTGPAPEAP